VTLTRIYLDSSPIIYLVERVEPFVVSVKARLNDVACTCVTSDLTRLECRSKPIRNGDDELLRDYDDYFKIALSEIIPLNRDVIDRATAIRAEYNFKTPDAIHLAAAIESGCDLFLTNDHRLGKFDEIKVEIVS
jgi:predicted nucleic acid-binding protein